MVLSVHITRHFGEKLLTASLSPCIVGQNCDFLFRQEPMISKVVESSSLVFVRSKTYTSNVMDETRSKRIREHFAFHKAMKSWRLEIHSRLEKWRAEKKAGEIAAMQQQKHAVDAASVENRMREQTSISRQHVTELEEEIRKAQLEYDVAQLRLKRAERTDQRNVIIMAIKARREEKLLEASRHWIGSKEELLRRIEHCLANPQPFGFITNLPKTTL
ncbi:hypothetical protein CEUSTIGMA_g10220.t1 [Chlamydomonas eustigma]|uniref:Uncharacterized protein n=1 Tax=Chlamydomonas eustigma TaxID=1157962 RepID=A0A250XI89_9CHLO|nr:hypothetical protein CEUSTIGMA_g10220.t1 [Chlamydomonas eustigma]|eukprot:GAX82794.1 hypothetical protein CEUSTIGMA_g10220.t1 [Chlamydomonas eustigma]